MDFVSNILPKMEENRLTVNLCAELWEAGDDGVDEVLAFKLNDTNNKWLELQFGIDTEYCVFFHSYNALASARHLEEVILSPEDDDYTSTYSFVAEEFLYVIAKNPHHIGAVGLKRLKLEGDSILSMVRWAKISKLAMQDLSIWKQEVSLAIPLSIASNTYIQHLVWEPESSQETTNLLNCLVVNTTLKRLTLDGSNGKSQFWGVCRGDISEESVLACQGLLVATNTLVQLELRCLKAHSLDPIVQGLIESQSVTRVFIEKVELYSVGALSGLYNIHKFHQQAFTLTPTLLGRKRKRCGEPNQNK